MPSSNGNTPSPITKSQRRRAMIFSIRYRPANPAGQTLTAECTICISPIRLPKELPDRAFLPLPIRGQLALAQTAGID